LKDWQQPQHPATYLTQTQDVRSYAKIETIPVQAGQLGKIKKEISAIIEETKETFTDPAK